MAIVRRALITGFLFSRVPDNQKKTRRFNIVMKRHNTATGLWIALAAFVFLLCGAYFLFLIHGRSVPPRVETGWVTSSDGVRLYYAKVGSGSEVAIIPGRLFTFSAFQRLAKGRTLIFYDMRNRGRSDAVVDPSKISLQHDTDDVEAVRVHFGIEKPDLIGFLYLGKIVVLYATLHPNHVNRIVQIGPVALKFGTTFPEALTAGDENKVPDPAEIKRVESRIAAAARASTALSITHHD